MRSRIKNQCKTYGSIRSKRRVEERRRATDSDSDYNDTEVDDTAGEYTFVNIYIGNI